MHDHPERPVAGDRQLRGAALFAMPEQDPLAGRAEHEEPLEPACAVEPEQRREGILVEPLAAVAQRRHRSRKGSGDSLLGHCGYAVASRGTAGAAASGSAASSTRPGGSRLTAMRKVTAMTPAMM